TGIRNWADPSGAGYQSTSRWGVAQLVSAVAGTEPQISLSPGSVVAGGDVDVQLTGFEPDTEVELVLRNPVAAGFTLFAVAAPIELTTVVTDAAGAASVRVTIPASTEADAYEIAALADEETVAAASLTVTAAAGEPGAGPGAGPGADPTGADDLADTGANIARWLLVGLMLLL